MVKQKTYNHFVIVDGENPSRRKWCMAKMPRTEWDVQEYYDYKANPERRGPQHIYAFMSKDIAAEFMLTWNGYWGENNCVWF